MKSSILINHRVIDTRLGHYSHHLHGRHSRRTPKDEVNKIREEEMERDNKEVHAHHSGNSAAFLLRVKNQVRSWHERARGTTHLVPNDTKTILLKSLGEVIRKQIKIWTTTNHIEVVSPTWSYCRIMGIRTYHFIGTPRTKRTN